MRNYVLVAMLAVFAIYYPSVECAEKMDLNGLKGMLKPMSKSCKRKTGVSDELVDNTHKGEFPRERALMCYFKCLSTTLKIMDKEGNVKLEDIEKQLTVLVKEDIVPRMKEVGYACYNEIPKGEDACEFAFNFAECAYKKDSSMYFLP